MSDCRVSSDDRVNQFICRIFVARVVWLVQEARSCREVLQVTMHGYGGE